MKKDNDLCQSACWGDKEYKQELFGKSAHWKTDKLDFKEIKISCSTKDPVLS